MTTKRVPRPDKVAYDKNVQAVRDRIEDLQKKLNNLQDKMVVKDPSLAAKRSSLKSELDALLSQRQASADKRNKVLETIKSLQASLKRKVDDAKAFRDRIGFKSSEEIDRRIMSLEQELESGTLKLIEEKRTVAEISNLRKTKKAFESAGSNDDSEKNQLDILRVELKELDVIRDGIREKLDAKRAQLNAVDSQISSIRGSMNDFMDQKKALKSQLDEAFNELRTLKTDFKTAHDAWFAFEQEERVRRKEAEAQRRKEEKEALLLERAEKELEAAEIPAFTEEIAMVNHLIQFFNEKENKPVDAKTTPTVASSLPDGSTLLVKEEEDFFSGTISKKTKAKKTKKQPFKLDFALIEQLAKLSISIPTSNADAAATISALEEKKKYFLENQAAQTEKNKVDAQARIAQLRASLDE